MLSRRVSSLVRFAGACFTFAMANLMMHRIRLTLALVGTGAALLVLLLQVAFLEAVRAKVTSIYDLFDFDIAIVPAAYQIVYYSGTLDRVRLAQARAVVGVADAAAFDIASSDWTSLPSERQTSLLVLGIDGAPDFIRGEALRRDLAALRDGHSVLMDEYSLPEIGPTPRGTRGRIQGKQVSVVGHFALGLFFYADGSAFVHHRDFETFTGQPAEAINMIFLHVTKGAGLAVVKERLGQEMPDDVRIYLRDEIYAQEQAFFISTKPIGIVLEVGMLTAFVVGAVILYQVLATDVTNRLKEHAMLKAMGFPPSFVYGIGLAQAAVLGFAGLLIAAAACSAILWFVDVTTHLASGFSLSLFGIGALVSLAMCIASVTLVLRRVQLADPAELY
jgi:putative ABC transport system permease protein